MNTLGNIRTKHTPSFRSREQRHQEFVREVRAKIAALRYERYRKQMGVN